MNYLIFFTIICFVLLFCFGLTYLLLKFTWGQITGRETGGIKRGDTVWGTIFNNDPKGFFSHHYIKGRFIGKPLFSYTVLGARGKRHSCGFIDKDI